MRHNTDTSCLISENTIRQMAQTIFDMREDEIELIIKENTKQNDSRTY
jgi:hypothetical protein